MIILQWTEPTPPNEYWHYNHIEAMTPFGKFVIKWKGWKEYPSYDIEETPWGEWLGSFNTLEDAKVKAEEAWVLKVQACL